MCSIQSTVKGWPVGSDRAALLMSIKPWFAELVLVGAKTVELRRVRPRVELGMPVLLYASSPQRALVGSGVVGGIGAGSPDEIWALHGDATGVSQARFREYFAGAQRAVAITVQHAQAFEDPLPLRDLRRSLRGVNPPQSFRYLDHRELDLLNGALRRLGQSPVVSRRKAGR